MTTTTNPRPYDLQPITDASPKADGRCAGCGGVQALASMVRDTNAGAFRGEYCDDCAAWLGSDGRGK